MKKDWRYWKSFVVDEVVERSSSPHNPVLEVGYSFGKKTLNTASVNYSFGALGRVFHTAFDRLHVSRREVETVLVLGLGAGNVPALLRQMVGDCHITGVDIDPEVIRLGRNHFGLGDYENMDIVNADALEFVHQSHPRYDLIVVDLFIDALVPEGASTPQFLKRLGELLAPGGLLLYNRVWHTRKLRQQTEAFTRKMSEVLPGTRFVKVHNNRMLYYEKKR